MRILKIIAFTLLFQTTSLRMAAAAPKTDSIFQIVIQQVSKQMSLKQLLPKSLRGLASLMPKDTAQQYQAAISYMGSRQKGPIMVIGNKESLIILPEKLYQLPYAARIHPLRPVAEDGTNPGFMQLTQFAPGQAGEALMDKDFKWVYFSMNQAFNTTRPGRTGIVVNRLEDPRLDAILNAKKSTPKIKSTPTPAAAVKTIASLKRGDKAMMAVRGAGVTSYEEVVVQKVTADKIYIDRDPVYIFNKKTGMREEDPGFGGFSFELKLIPPGGIPQN